MELFTPVETVFDYIVYAAILLMELAGVIVLVVTGVKSFIRWLKHDEAMRLELAQGISVALEFKIGGELLRTVVVREWSELAILGAIILLRGLLAILINWEIKNEEERLK